MCTAASCSVVHLCVCLHMLLSDTMLYWSRQGHLSACMLYLVLNFSDNNNINVCTL